MADAPFSTHPSGGGRLAAYEPTDQPLSLFTILRAKPHEVAVPEQSQRPAADRLYVR